MAPLSPLRAAITATGDVSPANPSTWTSSTAGTVGNKSAGSLTVNSGSKLRSQTVQIGVYSGSTGVVTVDGVGSTWTASNSGFIQVGDNGNGTLNITGGGSVIDSSAVLGGSGAIAAVTVDGSGSTWINNGPLTVGDSGSQSAIINITNGGSVTVAANYETLVGEFGTNATIHFGGGTLTTQTLLASPSQLTGTGTINAQGLVSDGALTFDATHGPSQALRLNGQGQNVTVNLDMSGSSGAVGDLGVGYNGSGSLTIRDGRVISTNTGWLGYWGGSTGVVTVDGPGSQWNCAGQVIGYYGNGSLNITNGGLVSTGIASIGAADPRRTGTVTVDGTGSTWTCSGDIAVGEFGTGMLNISNGSSVVAGGRTFVGGGQYSSGTAGTINFGAGGGTLTTASLSASPSQLTGAGTINASGLVSDVNLVLDSAASLRQTFHFTQQGQNVTVNLDLASNPTNNGDLGAGWNGNGSLTICNGTAVYSRSGRIAWAYGAQGMVTVEDAGSTWSNSDQLYVGYNGTGTLNIVGGGTVTATNLVSIPPRSSSPSLLAIDVGRGSSLVIDNGTGRLVNAGVVRVLAGAGAVARQQYTPIYAGVWSDYGGSYQAVGGTWDSTNHVFTVSDVKTGSAGTPVSIDLDNEQRVLVSDSVTGWAVGGSFLASSTSKPLNLTVTTIGGTTLSSLQGLLGAQQAVLGGWEFAFASGYTAGDPAYLSFGIGSGYSRGGLEIWHYDGSSWTPFGANDLTYDGTYASFTVTGFSGYAVTTVPEPGTRALLVAAGLGLCVYGGRKPRKTV